MSQTEPTTGPLAKTQDLSRTTVFRFTVCTVLATLVGWYINALLTFAGNTYGFNNRFTEVAVSHHWFHLVWSNIEVMKAYVIVALIFTAVIYPIVLLWGRWQQFGRWGVIWRALLLCGVLYGFFVFRLMLNKPYFGDYSYFDQGWKKFGDWFGAAIQHGFGFFVLYIFPAIAVLVCGLFYLNELRRLMKRHPRSLPWPLLGPAAILIGLVVTGHGFIKDEPRP
ncbi:MAG TPA: hypothetical protein VLE43_11330, partial [Candidatus Saccharimonadia bacterium]|nr:hypothetical protein [Candidatus Saccharimonadia bacterium]